MGVLKKSWIVKSNGDISDKNGKPIAYRVNKQWMVASMWSTTNLIRLTLYLNWRNVCERIMGR